ncbi:hypothetical protein AA0472_1834 [Acetobacter estunensis NRIC 0472]|uniref:Uncharacterized protein n=1 Tax=Acetobacter estunensis TaxID=104097 RepID=A0A967B7B4_9PROT|nr:hypothetical protein [Acetobacter estunensis]NHO55212.1 hypothetical protein [Acetobacter estunensis]GBQ25662.1 hypothetical protein AA0472_1834 [Acetobacter estunensis NRIC 0472]
MDLSKIQIARRQLGVATALFLDNADPVSVHCLACGAAEIVESIGYHSDTENFTGHILLEPVWKVMDERFFG